MTYRIITNNGIIDFAADLEQAQHKYKKYVIDMAAGFSEHVFLYSVDENGRWKVICGARR